METHALASVAGGTVELDVCFSCQGLWFDPQENLKLSAAGVVDLFGLLHARRDTARQPLALKMDCPRCSRTLAQGFDVVRSGRYITYRCPQRHGRFSAFSSFMIEKGFVRQLTRPEIDDMAKRVAVISCTSCGAPVDLRKDHACPHCRSAFSLLDPQAVERALQGYAKAASSAGVVKMPELADALVMVERDRAQARRDEQNRGGFTLPGDSSPRVDLWGLGIAMVWSILN